MKPEKILVTIIDAATQSSPNPVTRTLFPDRVGRFSFDNVPTGINYIIRVQDQNNLTPSAIEKPVFGSADKNLGAVATGECLFIQDIGYFYKFDFDGDGRFNESDEADSFFNAINTSNATEQTESENYLYNTSSYTVLPASPLFNLDSNPDITVNDASSAITGGTWFDPPQDSIPDTSRYNAVVDPNSNIPSLIAVGSQGEFDITFYDTSTDQTTEDFWLSNFFPERYYRLIRTDNYTELETSYQVLGDSGYDINTDKVYAKFRIKYKLNATSKSSLNLVFKLANTTTLPRGFGQTVDENITVAGQQSSTQWHYIQYTDDNGNSIQIRITAVS